MSHLLADWHHIKLMPTTVGTLSVSIKQQQGQAPSIFFNSLYSGKDIIWRIETPVTRLEGGIHCYARKRRKVLDHVTLKISPSAGTLAQRTQTRQGWRYSVS